MVSQIDESIHYLKVLKDNSSVFQPEIRKAIDYAIKHLQLHTDGEK